jgi:hypothetical protein
VSAREPAVGRLSLECRGCGQQRPAAYARKRASFDAANNTFLCQRCTHAAAAVRITCRGRCGRQRELPIWKARELTSFREAELTWLCKACTGRENTRKARAALLKSYGLGATATPSERADVFRHELTTGIERAGGRAKALDLAHRATAGGLSENARNKKAIGHILKLSWPGEFRLCPECAKLVYLSPARVAKGAHGFHRECYLAFTRTPAYQEWRRKIGWTRSPGFAARVEMLPMPVPRRRRGHPVQAEDVRKHVNWLLRHVLKGESWAEIAAAENFGRATVQGAVRTLVSLLPASWTMLFGGHGRASRRLDVVLPMDRVRRAIETRPRE